jgi:hypothetical protein
MIYRESDFIIPKAPVTGNTPRIALFWPNRYHLRQKKTNTRDPLEVARKAAAIFCTPLFASVLAALMPGTFPAMMRPRIPDQ